MSASPPGPYAADTPGAALLAAALAGAASSRDRLVMAGEALSRPRDFAIDDLTRVRAGLLIEGVIGTIETMLRAAEPRLDAAVAQDLPARFVAAGLLSGSDLAIAALLRAQEHRLAAALIVGAGEEEGPGARRLDPIGGGHAAESFAVRAAEAARLDRTGEPLLPLQDIAAEDRHTLFWQVAACLAEAALAAQGEARAGNEDAMHRAAAAAVARALALIDEADGIAATTMRLAEALARADQCDEAMLAGALAAGRVASLSAMLAVRAGIRFGHTHAMLTDPARCAVLLRACDVSAGTAAVMIVALAFALDRGFGEEPGEKAVAIIADYEALSVERAQAEVRRARLEPVYLEALAMFAGASR